MNLAIHLFNIDRSLFVAKAPVKNQCSRDYFYGEDELLEQALQATEGAYARGLSEILHASYRLGDEHRHLLHRFWLLQHQRTEAASRRAVEMSTGMAAVIGSPVQGFRMTIREAVETAMRTFVAQMDIVDDLKICLIRNRTTIPFITSDDPAVLTNRWYLEDRRPAGRSCGLASSGALLFLPLSPRVLCLGYDGDVYSLPNTGGWIDVRRERDITAFNQHQYLNCRANIYFREWDQCQRIQHDFDTATRLRPDVRHRINYAVFDRSENGADRFRVVDKALAGNHERALIFTQQILPKPSIWPTQIGWREKGKVYTNGSGVGYVRRSSMLRVGGDDFHEEAAN
jgi:hypothetical protein